jgi:hypothetical protein
MDWINQRVHFKIRDVYYPDPTTVLLDLYGDAHVEGTVVELTDGGTQIDAFVVVEVEGMAEPVIVPVERIVGTC